MSRHGNPTQVRASLTPRAVRRGREGSRMMRLASRPAPTSFRTNPRCLKRKGPAQAGPSFWIGKSRSVRAEQLVFVVDGVPGQKAESTSAASTPAISSGSMPPVSLGNREISRVSPRSRPSDRDWRGDLWRSINGLRGNSLHREAGNFVRQNREFCFGIRQIPRQKRDWVPPPPRRNVARICLRCHPYRCKSGILAR
jgi:hypothetical protein